MAILSFKVQADYEKVARLREEIAKLEAQMRSFGRNTPIAEIKSVETKLAEAKKEFTAITTEAAKAGATIEHNFKTKIHSASTVVNDLTSKIIEQKSVVKDVEHDVRKLGEAYQKALKSDSNNAPNIKADYDAAKKALQEEKAALFALTQEKAKASLETKKLKDEYAAFKEEAGEAVKANEGFTMSLGKIAGLVGGVTALKQLAAQVVRVRGEFQDMETAIETLVGKDMAGKLMPQIKEMAKVSPLTMTDIVGAEKTMLGFNIEAEKTIDYLKAISDISMGNSQKFNSLTLAFSQMSAAGKLMGQDLNQMIGQGFNPLQIISEKTGKSIAKLKEEMSKGAISAEMVQQAFLDATSAGGKFYNMSENASKTINGQISMMQDAMDAMFNEIGTKTEGVIIKSIQAATSLIQNYEKIGQVLVGLVTTYGAYRTAVFLSTAATSKHTIAEIALTNVRIAARKAQQALNAAMLTNPYVALAAVVGGLVTTYIALKDNTTAAEQAQKAYTAEKENAAQKEKEHADAIQGLIDKVRDETQAEGERVLALMALKNEYRNIFEQYDLESLKLADILNIKKQINEEDRKRRIEDTKGKIRQLSDEVVSMQYRGASQKNINIKKGVIEEYRRELLSEDYADFVNSLSGMEDEKLDAVIEKLKQISEGTGSFKAEISGLIVNKENYADFLEKYVAAANKEQEKRKAVAPNYGAEYRAAKEEWETAKKELEKIEKDKDNFTKAQYEAAKARKETAEKNFRALGGDTSGKAEKNEAQAYNEQRAQQERELDAQIKSDKERARTAKDMEMMVEQARIDAMEEGARKRYEQRVLDNKKELENLERQKQDYVDRVVEQEKAIFEAKEEAKAKENKEYKKQSFDESAVRANVDTSVYDKLIDYAKEAQLKSQDETLVRLLENYKSYEDKKMEIVKSYLEDSDILQAEYEATGDERFKRSLDERYKAYQKALSDLEKQSGSENYTKVFSDPSKMTKEGLEEALKIAKEMLATLDSASAPESYKTLVEAIERLENARILYDLEGWSTGLKSIVKTYIEIKLLQEQINAARAKGDKSAEKVAQEAQTKAKEDLRKSLVATGAVKFGNALSDAADAMRDIADASGDVHLASLAESFESMGGILSAVGQGAASGGALGAFMGGMSAMISSMSNVIKESAIMQAEAAKSAREYKEEMQLARLAIDEMDFSSIFGDRDFEKAIAALNKLSKATNDYAAAESDLLEDIKRGMDMSGGRGGTSVNPIWNDIRNSLYSPEDPNNLRGKLSFDVEKAETFLATNTVISEELRNQIQHVIDLAKAYETLNKEVEGTVSNFVSDTAQSLTDALFNAIDNGSDAWDLFAEKGNTVIRDIGKQMLTETIQIDLTNEWSGRIKAAAGDPKKLAEEYAAMMEWLKSQKDTYANAALQWEEMYGSSGNGSLLQQEASRKGYETLSEDTGNELVGRATAQYESNLRMEDATRSMKESVDIMLANNVQIRDIASESRALIADSYLELQQIRENTGAIIKPIKEMSLNVQEMKTKMDTL